MAKKKQEVETKVVETQEEKVQELSAQEMPAHSHDIVGVSVQEVPFQEFAQVVVNAEGKFQRKAVYNFYSSVVAHTRAEKVKLFNLLNGDGGALPMGEHINKSFKVKDVIFQPYDAVDEETGELLSGVLSYLFATDGSCYVTSSKSVYFTMRKAFQVFGTPTFTDEEAIEVKILKVKGKEFQYIDLEILG